MFIKWIKKRTNRLLISIMIAFAAVFLAAGNPFSARLETPVTAWWGTMYPGFCFSEKPEEACFFEDSLNTASAPKRKISFWLAKALNW